MRPRGSGHIVNIASQAGKAGIPGIATYSATKHAVVGISEAVRAELRGTGVEVACVMPTVVNTELTSGVGQKWVKPVEASDVAEAIVDVGAVDQQRRARDEDEDRRHPAAPALGGKLGFVSLVWALPPARNGRC